MNLKQLANFSLPSENSLWSFGLLGLLLTCIHTCTRYFDPWGENWKIELLTSVLFYLIISLAIHRFFLFEFSKKPSRNFLIEFRGAVFWKLSIELFCILFLSSIVASIVLYCAIYLVYLFPSHFLTYWDAQFIALKPSPAISPSTLASSPLFLWVAGAIFFSMSWRLPARALEISQFCQRAHKKPGLRFAISAFASFLLTAYCLGCTFSTLWIEDNLNPDAELTLWEMEVSYSFGLFDIALTVFICLQFWLGVIGTAVIIAALFRKAIPRLNRDGNPTYQVESG